MRLQSRSALDGAFGTANAIDGFNLQKGTLRELSDIGCVLFTVTSYGAGVAHSVSHAIAVELPVGPGDLKATFGRTALWLSPRSWLIQCSVVDELPLVVAINEAFPDKSAHAVPFTDALCWYELSGEGALDLLTEGSFSPGRKSFPIGHANRTFIAQIAAVIVRQGDSVWQIAVERSRARYFADWLSAAAETDD